MTLTDTLPAQVPDVETTAEAETERKQRLREQFNPMVRSWGEAFDRKYQLFAKTLGFAMDMDTWAATIGTPQLQRNYRKMWHKPIHRATVFRHLHDMEQAGIIIREHTDQPGTTRQGWNRYHVDFSFVIRHGQVVLYEFGATESDQATAIEGSQKSRIQGSQKQECDPTCDPLTSRNLGESSSAGLRAEPLPAEDESEDEISAQWAGFEFEEGMKFLGASGKTWQLEWDNNADDEIYPWVMVNYENEEDFRPDLCGDDLRQGLTDGTLTLMGAEPVPEEHIDPVQPAAVPDPDPVDEDVPDVPDERQLRSGLVFHSWNGPSVVLTREIDGNWLVCSNSTGMEMGVRTPDELLSHPYYNGGFYLEEADVEAIMAEKRERHERKYGKVEHDAESK